MAETRGSIMVVRETGLSVGLVVRVYYGISNRQGYLPIIGIFSILWDVICRNNLLIHSFLFLIYFPFVITALDVYILPLHLSIIQ